jgi:hypothetical protein
VYDEVMPLLISDPIAKGGLGFNTTRIGVIGMMMIVIKKKVG